MNTDERQMITSLFDRLRGQSGAPKIAEADTLIAQLVRAQPDAPYYLVQTVLVQEQAINEAGQRIANLEAQLSAAAPASGGSFLGGARAAAAGSVPSYGRPQASTANAGYAPQQSQAPSPWGRQPVQQPMQQPMPMPMQAPQASGGGGFFRQAITTAAGVAGGMMAANALSNIFGGGHHNTEAQSESYSHQVDAQNAAQDAEQDALEAPAPVYETGNEQANDPGYDTSGGGDFGGGDFGGSSDA